MNSHHIVPLLGAFLAASSTAFGQLIFDFEPTSPTELPGDNGFFDASGNPNNPDFSGGFGNSLFDQYARLEFVNLWVTPSNGTFPASSGSFKLQTFAGPGADTVIRTVGRPMESLSFRLTSGGFATLFVNGAVDRSISANPGSTRLIELSSKGGDLITEIRLQSFGSPPAGFFSLDELAIEFPRERLVWNKAEGGEFADPLAWSLEDDLELKPAGIPTFDDIIFDQDATYTVAVEQPFGLASIEVKRGEVTLDLATNRDYTLSETLKLNGTQLAFVSTDSVAGSRARLGQAADSPDAPNLNIADGHLVVTDLVSLADFGQTVFVETGATLSLLGMNLGAGVFNAPEIRGDLITAIGDRDAMNPADQPGLVEVSNASVNGSVTNVGQLKLIGDENGNAGQLLVTGDFVQSPASLLEVELLSATDSIGQSTKLVVEGEARLDGTLRITRGDGYAEARAGDFFRVLEADRIIGIVNSDPLIRGFVTVEGLKDTGNENEVFFGVDYNTARTLGPDTIDIVALEVPKRWPAAGPPAFITSGSLDDNIVFITHGHTDTIEGDNGFDDIARAMAGVAAERGVNDFDIITLNWGQFATGANDARSGFFTGDGTLGFYESARFGQQYGRILIDYLSETGILSSPGQLESVQFVAHSNGNYLADSVFDVFADSNLSPYGGVRPTLTIHTGLDVHLPPQTGAAVDIDLRVLNLLAGAALGPLADHAHRFEQYFTEGLLGTDNDPTFGGSASVNYEVTGYIGRFVGINDLGSVFDRATHSEPINFYLDTVTARLASPPTPSLPPFNILPSSEVQFIRENVGFSFSPLAVAAGFTTEELSLGADELNDGDIDLVRATVLSQGSVLVGDVTVVEISGVWTQEPGTGIITGLTLSPAVATLIAPVAPPVNFLGLDVAFESDLGGFMSVFVEDELVLDLPVSPGSEFSDLIEIDGITFAEESEENLSITVRLDPPDGGFIKVRIEGMSAGLLELDVISSSDCTADLAEPFGALNFFDVAAYITFYNADDPRADLAEPIGTFNFFDISAFITAYNAGCP